MPTVTELPTPPLYLAAKAGELAEVEKCLANDKTSALAVDPAAGGKTALAAAAAAGHTDIVTLLLKAGAVDASLRGWNAASHAAFGGHADTLRALVSSLGVATVAPPQTTAAAPLLLACIKGHAASATVIIDAAPSTLHARDARGRTPLMIAATSGSAELVTLLGERGAEINAVCNQGMTALMWAVVSHQPGPVEALARLGADPDICKPIDELDFVKPGKPNTKGETARELADTKVARDPTMRLISKYLENYAAQRTERPGEVAPAMDPLPWKAHAEQFVKDEAERAAAEAAAAAERAVDEPAIAELDDGNDIFGDADVAVTGGEALSDQTALKVTAQAEIAELKKSNADLDDLD
jgi:ankyrin repeat protein